MNDGFLLDTNIVTAYLGNDASLRRHLKGAISYVSAVTAGELLYGAHKSSERAINLRLVRDYFTRQPILQCDLTTAERYGLLRLQLEQRGTTIPVNDLWIAAHAMQYNLTLVSRDAHFERLTALGLKLVQW